MTHPKSLYDDADKESILEHALLLLNTSLRSKMSESEITKALANLQTQNKGSFGQLVELLHFGINNNSFSEPDFPKVGVELKTSPLKQTSVGLRSKERLVLNIIDYFAEDKATFQESSFWRKNKLLLLMLYLWKSEQDPFDYVFRDIKYWSFPENDMVIIRRDWQIIQEKIRQGIAHEISEGDTMYLGACTKGSTAEKSFREQPNSKIPAKQRAYSLKSRYVNLILDKDLLAETEPIIKDSQLLKTKTVEEVVVERFSRFYGKSVNEIVTLVNGERLNPNAKNFYANLTKLILSVQEDKEIEEFEKANVTIRTSRLLPNKLPKESISFPYFDFRQLLREEWDYSPFKEALESKFLFVFYRFENGDLILRKARFWNMPYKDIIEAKKVWDRTREVLATGRIIEHISRSGRRFTFFPNKSENRISHVRPHGRDRLDTTPLPVLEHMTGAAEYTKHCFWLNDEYVRDEIYMKD